MDVFKGHWRSSGYFLFLQPLPNVGSRSYMIFKCPEPLGVNPTLTEPVAGLYSAASSIKRGFPLLWA